MPILSRNDILKRSDLQKELVAVPEWGGEVWVRGLNGAERDQFEASILVQRGRNQTVNMTNVRAKLCTLAMCDEQGKALFSLEDVDALSQKSAAALDRVFVVAQRLSGIGERDVKEMVGNLEENPFDGSASASR